MKQRVLSTCTAAALAFALGCGDSGSGDNGGGDNGDGSGGDPSADDNQSGRKISGDGPAKSPGGRAFKDVCDRSGECFEYFSNDPDFSIQGDVAKNCSSRDERCPSAQLFGQCIRTDTNALGTPFDEITSYYSESDVWEEGCLEDGGTWVTAE